MEETKIAKVYLFVEYNTNRIEVTYHEHHKVIRVFLAIGRNSRYAIQYPNAILRDFTDAIKGYQITEFITNKEKIHPIIIQVFLAVCQRANGAIIINEATHNDTNFHTTLTPQARPNTTPMNDDTARMPLFSLIERMIDTTINNNTPLYEDYKYNVSSTNQITTPSDSQDRFTQNILNTMRNNIHEQSLSTESQYTNDNNEETHPPERFRVNARANREVIEQPNYTSEQPPSPSQSELNAEQQEDVAGHPHVTQVSISRRLPVNINMIKTLSLTIHTLLHNTTLRPPNFNSKTRSGYRKIKNFVHNITKVWLSNQEIDTFVQELRGLSQNNVSG